LPKQTYHIKSFEGGVNKKSDPRDIEENQLVEATNANVSNIGRVKVSGDGKSPFVTVNSKNTAVSPTNSSDDQFRFNNETPISSGYGLFSFAHDYNFDDTSTTNNPEKISTEFICINDGADIDVWTDIPRGDEHWKDSLISMGTVHNTGSANEGDDSLAALKCVKPIYYKADNGLRVCDANFGEVDSGVATTEDVDDENGSDPAETNITVTANYGTSFTIGEYVQINSEVMKITNTEDSAIIVRRGSNGTKIESHASGSIIYKLNVPKVLSHINRPMLKKAIVPSTVSNNVEINRWVQDIQVPEAPKFADFRVYNTNVVNESGGALSSNSIYPDGPEKVNLGILKSNLSQDNVFTLDSDDNPITSVTTSTETHLILTLALYGATSTTPINIEEYPFAVGKFLSISGAGETNASGTALNGVFEIIGFGSGTGQVKIVGDEDLVGYQGDGNEQIILEDEVMDDNLKNRYIFGMSYLYDGGGSEKQESNVTTGVFPSSRIFDANFINNWKTAPSGLGSSNVLDTSNTNNYDKTGPAMVVSAADGQFLFYENSSITAITHNTQYLIENISLAFSDCSGVSVKIYVGLGPGSSSGARSDPAAEGFVPLTITQPDSGEGLVYVSGIVTTGDDASHIDADVGITIEVIGAGGSGTERVLIAPNGTGIGISAWPNYVKMDKNNHIDFRTVQDIAKSSLTFLCNNSRDGLFNNTTPYNSWNERIEGFRIYMKQVDMIGDGMAEEWIMLYDVDLKEGTYVMHAKDADVENLKLGDISGNLWNATSPTDARAVVYNNLKGDSIKNIPLMTYESNNGYEADTNLSARYKAAAIVNRRVYIGNLKIGDKTFPDRMLKSGIDKFDTFADDGTHFIDVATSDGESIIALESTGNKLIQFKEKTAYLIRVTSEGEELEATWSGAGIKNPCQIAKSSGGIFWVNSNGIYYYDGAKLSNVSSDKFRVDNWITNEDFNTPVIVGYDKKSNKIIILTTNVSGQESGGYIYDISTGAVTQHNNIFNWYSLSNPTDLINGNTESEF
jgi:hypothetical protein